MMDRSLATLLVGWSKAAVFAPGETHGGYRDHNGQMIRPVFADVRGSRRTSNPARRTNQVMSQLSRNSFAILFARSPTW